MKLGKEVMYIVGINSPDMYKNIPYINNQNKFIKFIERKDALNEFHEYIKNVKDEDRYYGYILIKWNTISGEYCNIERLIYNPDTNEYEKESD